MYRNALVVGVRQLDHSGEKASVEQTMLSLGQNTGNMMFTQSLTSVLEGAAWGSFRLDPQDIEGHDAIVLAAANWVNNFDDFGWLAERLEKTKLPVFLIGVGAQASTAGEVPEVNPGTLRLLSLVHDRCSSISARGTFTCEVLSRYGIKSARPTGCPSLMLVGPQGRHRSLMREPRFDACSMHATRHGFSRSDEFQTFLYRQAFSKGLDLVLQSEVADIHYAVRGQTGEEVPTRAVDLLQEIYGAPEAAVAAYLERHGRVFTHYPDWISYMRQRSFCFGTRIHGTIAALIAGTPATLIVHDSRTVELAQIMGVPTVHWQNIPLDREIDIARLYSRPQLRDFVARFASYYSNFLDYMAENELAVAGQYCLGPQQVAFAS